MEEVGKRIQQAGKAHNDAMRKLAVGNGNLIGQAEMLRELGVKPSKQLPMQLVDRAQSKAQQARVVDVEGPSGITDFPSAIAESGQASLAGESIAGV